MFSINRLTLIFLVSLAKFLPTTNTYTTINKYTKQKKTPGVHMQSRHNRKTSKTNKGGGRKNQKNKHRGNGRKIKNKGFVE